MLASPSTAIDLPLKMLVWEDVAKKVWISYNSPEYLQKRHGFPEDLLPNISVLRKLRRRQRQVLLALSDQSQDHDSEQFLEALRDRRSSPEEVSQRNELTERAVGLRLSFRLRCERPFNRVICTD